MGERCGDEGGREERYFGCWGGMGRRGKWESIFFVFGPRRVREKRAMEGEEGTFGIEIANNE